MKKIVLIIFTLLNLYTVLPAQTHFSVTPSPASATGSSTDLYIKAVASVRNIHTTDLNMMWKRINVNIPSGWETSVCDPIKCHIPTVASNDFDLLLGDTGNMSVWFVPNGIPGTGAIQILIYNVSDSLNNHFINTYSVEATTSTSTEDLILKEYTLSPNPAHSYINLPEHPDVYSITIYDIMGKEIINSTSIDEMTYRIDFLETGSYIMQILDKDQNLLISRRLVKL